MSSVMVHPDVRACLIDLLDGEEHVGYQVMAGWKQPADTITGAHNDMMPFIVVYPNGGNQGVVDRVDRVVLECFAPGPSALNVLQSVHSSLIGSNITTPSGFIDTIASDEVPYDVPYPSDIITKATCRLLVTTRPI